MHWKMNRLIDSIMEAPQDSWDPVALTTFMQLEISQPSISNSNNTKQDC